MGYKVSFWKVFQLLGDCFRKDDRDYSEYGLLLNLDLESDLVV